MWEHKESYKGRDIWIGKDAEGRKCYTVSTPWPDGTRVEPRGTCAVYSLASARDIIREE